MSEQAIRAFIAIKLSEDVQNFIKTIQESLKKVKADVKWVKPRNAHLTLKFLGDVSLEKNESVKGALQKVVKRFAPFLVETNEIGGFPSEHNPRIIWLGLGLKKNTIADLASAIETELTKLSFAAKTQTFSTHITLGRVRSSRNISKLSKIIQGYQIADRISQEITTITLYQSQLTSSGPIYSIIDNFPLVCYE